MIDRLRDGGRAELHNAFLATVARRHGDDYDANCHEKQGCWWAREINIVTIADDYDAMTSEGPERAYKPSNFTPEDAVNLLRAGAEKGRYDPRLVDIFVNEVLPYEVAKLLGCRVLGRSLGPYPATQLPSYLATDLRAGATGPPTRAARRGSRRRRCA